ncbi:hypothetical protein CN514_07615 [Bacillus sp. AFS001701]|uniref:hypothetical protein n=1 Tax=Bacillus sp. AFS001701 TaxID=2033480 RepID=UPI000BF53D70|nr:hypothetical protein [Bacillus sp. AFS001701]PET71256.1 hypothetical protein CN514_07615 [Bacillus sp. AFS001701]
MTKVSVTFRMDPKMLLLLRKIAKEDFGSESKKVMALENAILAYHSQRLRPTEADAILSVTEQMLIETLEQRLESIGKNIVNRIGNLTAKNVYETCLTSLLVEDVHQKAGFNKNHYEMQRKEAAIRMKKKYDKAGLEEVGGAIEENEHLREVNTNVNARLEKATEVFDQMNTQIQTLESDKEQLQNQLQQKESHQKNLQTWVNEFTQHLIQNYSRLKTNSALTEEFIKQNPVPKEQS